MNRHDRDFPTHVKTSKTDHYTKSYPDFSLGGGALNSGTQFITNVVVKSVFLLVIFIIFRFRSAIAVTLKSF